MPAWIVALVALIGSICTGLAGYWYGTPGAIATPTPPAISTPAPAATTPFKAP